MVEIKNNGDTKQPVHTTSGVVFIHPGKSRDVELTEEGAKLVGKAETLTVGGKQPRKRPQKPKDAGDPTESVDVHSEDQTQSAGQSEDGSGEA